MKKIILSLVFSLILIPSSVFAETWIQLPEPINQKIYYYDIDGYGVDSEMEHIIYARIKMPLSVEAQESDDFIVDGEKANYIIYLVLINTIERYYTPLSMALAKDNQILAETKLSEEEIISFEDDSVIGEVVAEVYTKEAK